CAFVVGDFVNHGWIPAWVELFVLCNLHHACHLSISFCWPVTGRLVLGCPCARWCPQSLPPSVLCLRLSPLPWFLSFRGEAVSGTLPPPLSSPATPSTWCFWRVWR